MRRHGGPAFPQPLAHGADGDGFTSSLDHGEGGMTLRQWYAGQALAGLLAASRGQEVVYHEYADTAFHIADAMIAAGAR